MLDDTTSAMSASVTVKVPLAVSVVSVSVSDAATLSVVTTWMSGASLVPVMVTLTPRGTTPPWPSSTLKLKVSTLVWPTARYSTAEAATE